MAETKKKDEPPVRIEETPEWKGLFPAPMIKMGERLVKAGALTEEKNSDGTKHTMYCVPDNQTVFTVKVLHEPKKTGDKWKSTDFSCTCPEGQRGMMCVHKAAMLLYLEKKYGLLKTVEPLAQYQKRVDAYNAEQRKKEPETVKKEPEKKKPSAPAAKEKTVPALTFFGDRDKDRDILFLDFRTALKDLVTTPSAIEKELAAEASDRSTQYHGSNVFRVETLPDGTKSLHFEPTYFDYDTMRGAEVSAEIRGGSFTRFLSTPLKSPKRFMSYREIHEEDRLKTQLSEYDLAAVKKAWDYVDSQKINGDQTDKSADKFFKGLQKQEEEQKKKEKEEKEQARSRVRKVKDLTLSPRIIREYGETKYSFKTGHAGDKEFVIKDLAAFADAYQEETVFQLTKKETLDFSREDYDERYAAAIDLIIRDGNRVRGTSASNYQQNLTDASLRLFYEACRGMECEYQFKGRDTITSMITIGHKDLSVSLTIDRLGDTRGKFAGVIVSGTIPVLLKGFPSSTPFLLSQEALSESTEKEQKFLSFFTSVSDREGGFRFQVGLSHLQEFYYRVLPGLMESPYITLTDNCGEEAASCLPPEAVFTFYADLEDGILSLKGDVLYGQRKYTVGVKSKTGEYRDTDQEDRVEKEIQRTFRHFDPDTGTYTQPADDGVLYLFLTEGLEGLERYGEVRGTDAITRLKVRRTPSVIFDISIDSGLLDLSVTSEDLSREELLAVLESYSLKKRYHRLKSGDYIDLTQSDEIDEMEALLDSMDLQNKDVVGQKMQLPIFRALYLDRLLERHDAIAASRDRTFRALIKNFRTIRDADYDAPQSLAGILRPYQNYALKWLETLEHAGFGGILADEMGLGKTLELISVLLLDKESGEQKKPSLVVCPASVVYNWSEEIHRFAPALRAVPLGGTPDERKEALRAYEQTDVFITSYDLLKRDISLYHDLSFHVMAVDEAQNIKTPTAAQTKAVKVIRADHRFALTGTPIENRLSELWSIFDFVMPGFLYDRRTFQEKFETPITKSKDPAAAEKLRQMTGPFILRRKKEDVLKDLPAKLEEVRYAKLEGEQQKLYDAQVIRIQDMIGGGADSGEDKIRILAELTRLREICCDPSLIVENYKGESAKRQACMELIHSAIDGGHRMLVFSQFTSMLALLEQDLQKDNIPYYKIIGETPKAKRMELVHQFNEGDVPVFLISLKAGGTGLNLTGADVVIHYDPWWNLAAQNQATDRAHRIGQTREVTVYRLIAKGTIEENILKMQEAKKDLAEAILEGESTSLMSLSPEELMELLK